MRVEQIGDATLYLGDCLEILPTLPKVDAVVTDPPYGVGLEYEGFKDTPEYVEQVAIRCVLACIPKAKRIALTPGIKNMWLYPRPDHCGSFYYPAGAGCNSWGFTCWQPIFYYGRCPYLAAGKGSRSDSFTSTEAAEKSGHPCPKPVGQMIRLVERASLDNESVLDPFMGSGTTGVACANLGRKFIGIEIEPKYFDIACERIDDAYRQQRMFA